MLRSMLDWKFLRCGFAVATLAVIAAVTGCGKRSGEFLLVYAGDGQAYIEPCG